MITIRKTGDKTRYEVRDRDCLGRQCLAPGLYQHRGATCGGSRATGSETACCLERAYRGCPAHCPIDPILAKARRDEGWKVV